MSLYTSRAADIFLPFELLISYDRIKFLRTLSKDIVIFEQGNEFTLVHLLGP